MARELKQAHSPHYALYNRIRYQYYIIARCYIDMQSDWLINTDLSI